MRKIISLFLVVIFSVTSFVEGVFAYDYADKVLTVSQSEQTRIVVYENGVEINGKYYSQEEFTQLLQETQWQSSVASSGHGFRFAAAAGVYFIPGVGEVVIAATGVIIIGGAVIYSGHWLYETVKGFFASRANEYEKAKKSGQPTEQHSKKRGRRLNKSGEPYSSQDLYSLDGTLKQRRYYDEKGEAEFDIDFYHKDDGKNHEFPHCHDWVNGVRVTPGKPCNF